MNKLQEGQEKDEAHPRKQRKEPSSFEVVQIKFQLYHSPGSKLRT